MHREMTPHGVFSEFPHYDGWAEPGFERWFHGVNIRDWLLTGHSKPRRAARSPSAV